MAQTVKTLPAMRETRVPSLDQEGKGGILGEGTATHPEFLSEKSMDREPGGLYAMM